MTKEQLWPLGTRVQFDCDGLKSKGIIFEHGVHNVKVLLDDIRVGWSIYDDRYPNRTGWWVGYHQLKRCNTKLGNEF